MAVNVYPLFNVCSFSAILTIPYIETKTLIERILTIRRDRFLLHPYNRWLPIQAIYCCCYDKSRTSRENFTVMVLFLSCQCVKATYIFEDWLFSYFHNINFRYLFLIIVDYIILSKTPVRDTRKPEQICIHLGVLES